MKTGNLIEVQGASVHYRVPKSRRTSLRESLFRTLLRSDEIVDVWALKEVSFELHEGDSLGIIGNNGAGKSTLCLLLSKIMDPTSGTVNVAGSVSALLTLGAGFQTELTGRDNILLNGAFLGYRLDEIRERYDEIVAFSELEEHIGMPVRTYSSGMRTRLAFSIASSIQPEILIIDEVMGVGDRAFKAKSGERMREMVQQSKALVVVSHTMETILELCTRVVWLEDGRLREEGPAAEVVQRYVAAVDAARAAEADPTEGDAAPDDDEGEPAEPAGA